MSVCKGLVNGSHRDTLQIYQHSDVNERILGEICIYLVHKTLIQV